MRHNTRTVNHAMVAFDWLDRQGITINVPDDFQPVKYGDRTFGQLEALENKLSTAGVDEVLADQAPKPTVPSMSFSAVKVSETTDTITFHVQIRRGRTGAQLVKATKRADYTNSGVVKTMPLIADTGVVEEFDYVVFKPGRRTSDTNVEVERTGRGLVRDLEVQFLINAQFPEFADQHPNGDSWRGANGNWNYAYFSRGGVRGGRCVGVDQGSSGWDADDWFGGRKVSQ